MLLGSTLNYNSYETNLRPPKVVGPASSSGSYTQLSFYGLRVWGLGFSSRILLNPTWGLGVRAFRF